MQRQTLEPAVNTHTHKVRERACSFMQRPQRIERFPTTPLKNPTHFLFTNILYSYFLLFENLCYMNNRLVRVNPCYLRTGSRNVERKIVMKRLCMMWFILMRCARKWNRWVERPLGLQLLSKLWKWTHPCFRSEMDTAALWNGVCGCPLCHW